MESKKEKTIYDLKENEQLILKSFGGGTYETTWIVQRVSGGWIYHEENPRITRTPMVVFVPMSSEFLTSWMGRKVILRQNIDMNNCALEGVSENTPYPVLEESGIAIRVHENGYWINKNKFNII